MDAEMEGRGSFIPLRHLNKALLQISVSEKQAGASPQETHIPALLSCQGNEIPGDRVVCRRSIYKDHSAWSLGALQESKMGFSQDAGSARVKPGRPPISRQLPTIQGPGRLSDLGLSGHDPGHRLNYCTLGLCEVAKAVSDGLATCWTALLAREAW